jgi:MoxR-like ATPase
VIAQTREGYGSLIQAVGICVSSRIPFLLWGSPGEGKTAVIESARDRGWHVETIIVSHYEPSDLVGLPVVGTDGSVTLAPPAWAKRLASHEGPSIAFFDEWTTASPAVQAAALRPLTHGEVGTLQLPHTVAFGAAANPADVAVGGWELAAPTANRFCHLDWTMPLEVYAECLVTGRWPAMNLSTVSADSLAAAVTAMRVLVTGFLRARPNLLAAMPRDGAERGRAFPTPRSWDYLARLLGLARAVDAGRDVEALLGAGTVGPATAHEFLVWVDAQDLLDPEALLSGMEQADFERMRPDRVYVILQGLLSAVSVRPTPERWEAAVRLCADAATNGGMDAAVPVIRALMREEMRPAGTATPPEIRVFAAPLALAGLLPEARS